MSGDRCDVAVVGGGLGGLATAALLARGSAGDGLDVRVLERASEFGGRAGTRDQGGFLFNEGAHALYRGGAAARVLQGLGVGWSGRRPGAAGLAVLGGRAHALPSGLGALLTTGLAGWSGKLQGARVLARARRGALDTAALAEVSWDDWARRHVPDDVMRATLEAFVRVATYANAPSLVSAGATLEQLRLAQASGVDYLDGGWKTLVNATASVGRAAGAQLQTRARVQCATPAAGGGWVVTLAEGEPLRCRALVLALGPAAARSIVACGALEAWSRAVIPARVACLDVALARLPDARTTFALGIDQPLYLSVHSHTARLAPEGAALVCTMKYLDPAAPPAPARDTADLEAFLDLLQPGWREVLVARRLLPSMIATNAVVTARGAGTAGRPGPRVPGAPGVFVVGDWIGGEGMLLDACLASAERAAREVRQELALARVA